MKTKGKALLLVLCAILLVVASVLGTLAYLKDEATVTNTFTVGNVAITLNETDVDEYGVAIENAPPVTENEYKLIPGHKYKKDPIIHVDADSEDCYLFVKITDNIADIQAPDTIAQQLAANGWALVDGETDVYYHNAVASKSTDVPVFDYFKIKGEVESTELATYNGKNIVVIAYAVQEDGFNNAQAAWEATYGAPVTP